MARGESERGMFRDDRGEEGSGVVMERGERERSTERERREGVRESYPPCDYANTFNTQNHSAKDAQTIMVRSLGERQRGKILLSPSFTHTHIHTPQHPVVLAGKKSKWTAFIEPPKDEDVCFVVQSHITVM